MWVAWLPSQAERFQIVRWFFHAAFGATVRNRTACATEESFSFVSECCGQSPSKHPPVCREILALRATDRTGRCALAAVLEMERREACCRPERPSHQGPGMLPPLEHEDHSSTSDTDAMQFDRSAGSRLRLNNCSRPPFAMKIYFHSSVTIMILKS